MATIKDNKLPIECESGLIEILLDMLRGNNKLQSKAIEIIKQINFTEVVQEQLNEAYLRIISENESPVQREFALQRIILTEQNIDSVSCRIRDVSGQVRKEFMKNLVSSQVTLEMMSNNSLFHICYNCNYMKDDEMKIYLSRFLLKKCINLESI